MVDPQLPEVAEISVLQQQLAGMRLRLLVLYALLDLPAVPDQVRSWAAQECEDLAGAGAWIRASGGIGPG